MSIPVLKRDFEFFAVSKQDRWKFFATITKFDPQDLELYREAIRRSGRDDLRIAVSARYEFGAFFTYSLVVSRCYGNDITDFWELFDEIKGKRDMAHYRPEYEEFNFDKERLPAYEAAVEQYGSDKLSICEGGFDRLGNYYPDTYALICTDTKTVNFSKFWNMVREAENISAV